MCPNASIAAKHLADGIVDGVVKTDLRMSAVKPLFPIFLLAGYQHANKKEVVEAAFREAGFLQCFTDRFQGDAREQYAFGKLFPDPAAPPAPELTEPTPSKYDDDEDDEALQMLQAAAAGNGPATDGVVAAAALNIVRNGVARAGGELHLIADRAGADALAAALVTPEPAKRKAAAAGSKRGARGGAPAAKRGRGGRGAAAGGRRVKPAPVEEEQPSEEEEADSSEEASSSESDSDEGSEPDGSDADDADSDDDLALAALADRF